MDLLSRTVALACIAIAVINSPAPAQAPPYGSISPGAGTYVVGTQLQVHVELCSPSSFFDAWGTVWLNGVTLGSTQPGSNPGCSDFQWGDFTITMVEGANTVSAQATDNIATAYVEVTYTGTPAPPPPPAAPIVTPDARPVTVAPVSGMQQTFAIYNGDPTARTYTLTLACTGAASGCSSSASQITASSGQSAPVTVTYSVSGAFPATGAVSITATDQGYPISDQGSVNVTVAPSGPVVDRGACLTIAAGAGAAFECGDLRLVHALPGVRTLNTPRAPVLLYNSQHAHPYALVTADVTLPTGAPLPTTVRAILWIDGVKRDSTDWPGAAWVEAGQTRRIVQRWDADTFPTKVYAYRLELLRIGPGVDSLPSVLGQLAIVNRRSSPFGSGWWLGGYERLYFTAPPGQVYWVGGDGSFRRYERLGVRGTDTVYLAPPLDYPDTLLHTNANLWVRLLPGGSRVTFTAQGFHWRTTNRLGYMTEFFPDSVGKLLKIKLPPDTIQYSFGYDGTPARLATVTVRDSAVGANRVTALNWVGDSLRVVEFTGTADSTVVVFQYQAGGSNRIVARRDRRRTLTAFTYDAGNRLSSSRLGIPSTDSIIRTFCAAEVRGLAACSPALVKPESAYAIFDGPRTPTDSSDVVHFWVHRLGAPWKIRDPYGNITALDRADPRWPALVTRAQHANGRVLGATYDARGNLESQTDSGVAVNGNCPPFVQPPCLSPKSVTTTYAWDQQWDAVTQITLPNGQLSRSSYDANNGNRLWQEDGRGSVSRVTFTYVLSGNGAGLVRSVTVPDGGTDSLFYDVLGNLDRTKTPMQWVTYSVNDRLGRTTRVRTPVNAAQTLFREDSTYYNRRGLPYRTVSYGPPISYTAPAWNVGAQTVIRQQTYDDEGQLIQLNRKASPDTTKVVTTQWVYDVAGRQTVEIDAVGFRDSASYDPAGNIVRRVSRRRTGVPPPDVAYDRLNRPRRRILPEFLYPKRTNWPGLMVLTADTDSTNQPFNRAYPWFPSESDGRLRIPADTSIMGYDGVGNLILASNRWARIKRTYSKDGLIERDSSWIRDYGDTTFSHAYILYGYDENRRLTAVQHPSQLAPGTSTTKLTSYAYDPISGELATVTDALGNAYQLTYSARGDRIRTQLPGSIVDTASYDLDGKLISHRFKNYNTTSPWPFTGSQFRNDTLTYADPVRIATSVSSMGYRENTRSRYSGLGHLVSLYSQSHGDISGSGAYLANLETSTFDGLGNVLYSRDSATFRRENDWNSPTERRRTWSYEASTGRLSLVADSLQNNTPYRHDRHSNDEAGNLQMTNVSAVNTGVNPVFEERASYFDAEDRLRFAEFRRLRLITQPPQECWNPILLQWNTFCWEVSWPWAVSFEEYRYDALGRRVLVRNRQDCGTFVQTSLMHCNIGTIRRTVWQGDHELYEIQQYGGQSGTLASTQQVENDTSTTISWVSPGTFPITWDPNPQFGRVGYTVGPKIDGPLGAIRIALVDTAFAGSDRARHLWAPFVIAPHWNWRGRADYGTFGDGGTNLCWTPTSTRCVSLVWRAQPFVFMSTDADTATRWFGTVHTMKRDASGLHFKRNRFVDPNTGRFTQEDPIGLAGGLNLYGFANGDPVTFSDPFGLTPCGQKECPPSFWRQYILDWVAEQARMAGEFFGGIIERISPYSPKAMTGVDLSDPTRKVGIAERLVAQADATSRWLPVGLLRRGTGPARLTNNQAKDLAEYLGYRRVRGAPFSSHGQSVFWNGKNYITQDIDSLGGVWKMFNRAGERLGTFDELLLIRIGP